MFYDVKLNEDSIKMFEDIGVDFERLMREAGIPPRAVQNGKFQLSTMQYKDLFQSLDKHIKPELMVSISKVDTIASFNPEFFAGLCAENGMECIKRISKYKKIIAPVNMMVFEEDERVRISYTFNDGSPIPEALIIHVQISILSILRKGTGLESLKPLKVVGHSPYPELAKSYIGVEPIVRANENEIAFSLIDLNRPFITKNNIMWDFLESELNQRLREMETDLSFSATVRKTLLELLPAGVSDADKISHELGMSKRTLQRRLKEEKTSFNEQLNHTRELMVRNYIKMDMTLDEIAFLVSYSDAKSLSRAFKIWTGMSVTEYRSAL